MNVSPQSWPATKTPSHRGGRSRILCVDDDRWVLEGLSDVLSRTFAVTTAASPLEALALLKHEPDGFAVLLSDLRMPGMRGSEFLRMARLVTPNTVRVLLTGEADIPAAVRAVNDGQVFRFLTKPCDAQQLLRACAAALGQHRLQTGERALVQDTLRGCVDALAAMLALTNPTAAEHAARATTLAGDLARAANIRNDWELEAAARLHNLGAAHLPPATVNKLAARAHLTDAEAALVQHTPHVTRRLLSTIAPLQGVLDILAANHLVPAPADDEADNHEPGASPTAAQVLRIALDYTDLEHEDAPPPVALAAMHSRGIYDPALLDLLAAVLGVSTSPRVQELQASELRLGMTLADDARSTHNHLLLARGQRVTEGLIDRIAFLGPESVRQPVRVLDTAPVYDGGAA